MLVLWLCLLLDSVLQSDFLETLISSSCVDPPLSERGQKSHRINCRLRLGLPLLYLLLDPIAQFKPVALLTLVKFLG